MSLIPVFSCVHGYIFVPMRVAEYAKSTYDHDDIKLFSLN